MAGGEESDYINANRIKVSDYINANRIKEGESCQNVPFSYRSLCGFHGVDKKDEGTSEYLSKKIFADPMTCLATTLPPRLVLACTLSTLGKAFSASQEDVLATGRDA